MNDIVGSIRQKLAAIKQLVTEIEDRVEMLNRGSQPGSSAIRRAQKPQQEIPSPEELREQFDEIYSRVNEGDSAAIQAFVAQKGSKYLDAFCRANNLPSDARKVGKTKVAEEIARTIAQRRAITRTSI